MMDLRAVAGQQWQRVRIPDRTGSHEGASSPSPPWPSGMRGGANDVEAGLTARLSVLRRAEGQPNLRKNLE